MSWSRNTQSVMTGAAVIALLTAAVTEVKASDEAGHANADTIAAHENGIQQCIAEVQSLPENALIEANASFYGHASSARGVPDGEGARGSSVVGTSVGWSFSYELTAATAAAEAST